MFKQHYKKYKIQEMYGSKNYKSVTISRLTIEFNISNQLIDKLKEENDDNSKKKSIIFFLC